MADIHVVIRSALTKTAARYIRPGSVPETTSTVTSQATTPKKSPSGQEPAPKASEPSFEQPEFMPADRGELIEAPESPAVSDSVQDIQPAFMPADRGELIEAPESPETAQSAQAAAAAPAVEQSTPLTTKGPFTRAAESGTKPAASQSTPTPKPIQTPPKPSQAPGPFSQAYKAVQQPRTTSFNKPLYTADQWNNLSESTRNSILNQQRRRYMLNGTMNPVFEGQDVDARMTQVDRKYGKPNKPSFRKTTTTSVAQSAQVPWIQ